MEDIDNNNKSDVTQDCKNTDSQEKGTEQKEHDTDNSNT